MIAKPYLRTLVTLLIISFIGVVMKKTYDAGYEKAVLQQEAEYKRQLEQNYKDYDAKTKAMIKRELIYRSERERYWSDRLQREVDAAKAESEVIKTVEVIKHEIPRIETKCTNIGADALRLHRKTREVIKAPDSADDKETATSTDKPGAINAMLQRFNAPGFQF